ncbi:MAG: winged helix-turn-helix domain-containing protein [Nitrosotalea sp.]
MSTVLYNHVLPKEWKWNIPQVIDFTEQSLTGWGNRGWPEIIAGILQACQNGALKTHVMYMCNLNSRQLSYYLQLLQDRGLLDSVESSPSKTVFHTTESGRRYMSAYRQLEGIFR